MEKIADFIVKHRKIFALSFLALIIFSFFSFGWVYVEEDITVYLPESAEAKQGLSVLNEEFSTYASSTVMLNKITYSEASYLAELAGDIPGVLMVSFDDTEAHYKDGNALLNITFNGTIDDELAMQAAEEVKELFSPYDTYQYSSFSNYFDVLIREMANVLVIVAIVVIVVLLFTSTTYAEVLVLLGTFIAAAIINMGTNFLMGTISVCSNAVAIVLQLALSVDYAIIFCNRYKEEHETKPVKEAVSAALAYSVPTILASSLTTIAGLLAMTFMKFRLGLDMGTALIKSIIISMLSVFLFMPYLLVTLGNWMDKTRHKSFVPKIPFVGRFAYASRYIIPILFCFVLVFAYFSYGQIRYDYSGEYVSTPKENEETVAKRHITECFGNSNVIALIVPAGNNSKEASLVADIEKMPEVLSVMSGTNIEALNGFHVADSIGYHDLAEMADLDEVTAKALFAYYAAQAHEQDQLLRNAENYRVPLLDLFLSIHDAANNEEIWSSLTEDLKNAGELAGEGEEAVVLDDSVVDQLNEMYDLLLMVRRQLLGTNYHCVAITVDLPQQSRKTFDFLDRLHILGSSYYGDEIRYTGDIISTKDFADSFEDDNTIVSVLSIILVIIVLFFTFKSAAMPILLIFVIQGSIWINFASSVWRGEYIFFMCYLIVSSIQMGANIDYAIVISSRYNELRAQGIASRDAIIETLNLAFPTIITSGTMMVVSGFVIGRNVSETITAGMGTYVGTGTVITLILVNFVLPQILIFGDSIVQKTSFRLPGGKLLSPTAKRVIATLLAVASMLSLAYLPVVYYLHKRSADKTIDNYQLAKSSLTPLYELEKEFSSRNSETDDYEFAKYYVTDSEGSKLLEEGREQLDEAEQQLAEGQKQYDDGLKQYQQGLNEYWNGLTQYEAGSALYESSKAQYEEGLAQYEEGKAKYDAGLAEYNAAKEKYDAGLAQYEEGKAQYDSAKALYDTLNASYIDMSGLVESYYEYLEIERQYNEAVAANDTQRQFELYGSYVTMKFAFDTKLALSGQTLGELLLEYEKIPAQLEEARKQLEEAEAQIAEGEALLNEGKAELDAAQKQLEEGEAQLNDAKRQLDEGKAQLDEAERQLAAGQAQLSTAQQQLAEGKNELDSGYEQYEDGKAQLEEASKYMSENASNLSSALSSLDQEADVKTRLERGISILRENESIAKRTGKASSYLEILDAASAYFSDGMSSARHNLLRYTYRMLSLLVLCLFILIESANYLMHGKLLLPRKKV